MSVIQKKLIYICKPYVILPCVIQLFGDENEVSCSQFFEVYERQSKLNRKKTRAGGTSSTNQILEKMNTEVEDHVRMKKKEDEEKSI